MLFNEPKLLKFNYLRAVKYAPDGFSALQRAEIAEILRIRNTDHRRIRVSVLFNEPKLLKFQHDIGLVNRTGVSVLFNEPKLLKCQLHERRRQRPARFSALQRAEIAEMLAGVQVAELGVA